MQPSVRGLLAISCTAAFAAGCAARNGPGATPPGADAGVVVEDMAVAGDLARPGGGDHPPPPPDAGADLGPITGDAPCTPGGGGNPFVDGWYADPDMKVYGGVYWVFPTYSAPFDQQTFLDAFSSPDLIHWTKHSKVLDVSAFSWAHRAVWAPSPITRNGKYYLYFGANDIQSDSEVGGIGVGVADQPGGPYKDAIGAPLIGKYANGAQPIDQDVFIDDDGQAYLYYGGHSHCNVVKLNADMVSLGTFADGSTFKEITPSGYVEGALMFKRNGVYYLMWSEGGWTGPDYRVSYSRASSPLGPFPTMGTILSQDAPIGTGAGHNTVVNVPGTDDWYIFYHRHPLGDADGNHRVLAYDRLRFAADGSILPVTMTLSDRFCDGDALGWSPLGSWSVANGRYVAATTADEARSTLNTNFYVLAYDLDVTPATGGDGGLMFRASAMAPGLGQYRGYYALVDAAHRRVVLGKAMSGSLVELATMPAAIDGGSTHHLRVVANGKHLALYLDGGAAPALTADDGDYAGGATGLLAHGAGARFGNVAVTDPPGAIFYQDAGYGGPGLALNTGGYLVSQLAALGIPNDSVSSIRVPAGLEVQMYADEGFSGTKWIFDADVPLMPDGANDILSSVKVVVR